MWPSKPPMNLLAHRINAILGEGLTREATREEQAEVLITVAALLLGDGGADRKRAAELCHRLVDHATRLEDNSDLFRPSCAVASNQNSRSLH